MTPKLSGLNVCQLITSVGQEFKNAVPRRFWLRVSCEVTFKLSARPAVSSESLTGLEDLLPMWLPHTVVGWRPQFLTTWASPQAACMSSNMAAGIPQSKRARRKSDLYDLLLEVTFSFLFMRIHPRSIPHW